MNDISKYFRNLTWFEELSVPYALHKISKNGWQYHFVWIEYYSKYHIQISNWVLYSLVFRSYYIIQFFLHICIMHKIVFVSNYIIVLYIKIKKIKYMYVNVSLQIFNKFHHWIEFSRLICVCVCMRFFVKKTYELLFCFCMHTSFCFIKR